MKMDLFVLSLAITAFSLVRAGTNDMFRWVESDNLFDCIVGIAHNQQPVSVGTIVGPNIVITAANPIQQPEYGQSQLAVYAINGNHTYSKEYQVECVNTPFQAPRDMSLAEHGMDGRHSPLHDILFLTVNNLKAVYRNKVKWRFPFIARMALENATFASSGLGFAGFGYYNKEHVIENKNLSFEFFEHDVLEDCDSWLPRDWGLFICVLVEGDLLGLPAGAALSQNGLIYGIGSFALHRGNQTVFVFTDIRPYRKKMFYCTAKDQFELFNETAFFNTTD